MRTTRISAERLAASMATFAPDARTDARPTPPGNSGTTWKLVRLDRLEEGLYGLPGAP